jgi:DNA polymerase-3 subunit delta
MQIRADGLEAALKRVAPPLVWIHGDEPLLRIEATDSVRRALRQAGFDEREVFTVERGFKVEALLAETQSLSLFATNRLIELRLNAKPAKELGQALAQAVEDLPDAMRILVSGPRLDRATLESPWFVALDRFAWVMPVYPVERARLPQWIAQRLERQGQQADADTLEFLAERVEGNLLAAHQEIRKLGLLFPEGRLPGDEVRQAVLNVARYDAFGLAEAMLAGDVGRTLRSLDGLRAEGEAEPLVLWALADAIRNLARLAQARDAGRAPATMMRELRIYGPREALYLQALRRVGSAELARALQTAAGIDRIVKGLTRGDAWSEMTSLATSIAGAPALAGN